MANDLWQTPDNVLQACREAMGGEFDLDPCSSEEANRRVRAARFFTEEQDALRLPWEAERAWMNMPFSRGKARYFAERMAEAWAFGMIKRGAALISADSLVSAYGAEFAKAGRVLVLPNYRFRFILPGTGGVGDSPRFGIAIVLGGELLDTARTERAFRGWGNTWVHAS